MCAEYDQSTIYAYKKSLVQAMWYMGFGYSWLRKAGIIFICEPHLGKILSSK
jgi:hypothetical protein